MRTHSRPFTYCKYVDYLGLVTCLARQPPPGVLAFARGRDETIAAALAAIHQVTPSNQSTHTLLVGMGGARLTLLERHALGSYLGAFFRIAGLLHQRLTAMGGSTSNAIATTLQNPS